MRPRIVAGGEGSLRISVDESGLVPNREPVGCQAAPKAGFPNTALRRGEGDHAKHRSPRELRNSLCHEFINLAMSISS